MFFFLYNVRELPNYFFLTKFKTTQLTELVKIAVTAQGYDETNLDRKIFNSLKKTYNSNNINFIRLKVKMRNRLSLYELFLFRL